MYVLLFLSKLQFFNIVVFLYREFNYLSAIAC